VKPFQKNPFPIRGDAMNKTILRVSALTLAAVPALMLSACGGSGGGDSHTEAYHGVPYTHERTAGSGVAYVRGKLLPPKDTNTKMMEMKVEPKVEAAPTPPPPVPVQAPVTQGDKMFDRKQSK
jgi:hypothetical protein